QGGMPRAPQQPQGGMPRAPQPEMPPMPDNAFNPDEGMEDDIPF
ncbi:MAG TPA: single-stranded DNA-binding protein, partial [Lentisphaeria bacterium]|nr:single-stranded DNA-binding protein [Lentisphaeria bacterium]